MNMTLDASRTRYEVWDIESANLLAVYPTEEAALAFVRQVIAADGPAMVATWELARAREDQDTMSIAMGDQLADRARRRISA
jgi:hypothetical protein